MPVYSVAATLRGGDCLSRRRPARGRARRRTDYRSEAYGKYATYLKRFMLAPPRRYFTDHNYAQKLVPTLELIRSGTVERILNAACGNGFEAVLFALHEKPVSANDISAARTTVAQARALFYRELLGESFRLSVSCGNAIEMADRLSRFDLVYVQEAISHIHPAEAFLRQVAEQMLTSHGRLVICDSNGWNPVTRMRISRHLWAERGTLRHYVEEQLEPETGRKYLMAEERLFSSTRIHRALRRAGRPRARAAHHERICGAAAGPPARIPAGSPNRRGVRECSSHPSAGGFYTAIGRRRAA
jgi:SAM-dependent methyltransferase